MSKKQIDVYRTEIYLRLSQGDEDVDGLENKESNSISNQKLLWRRLSCMLRIRWR